MGREERDRKAEGEERKWGKKDKERKGGEIGDRERKVEGEEREGKKRDKERRGEEKVGKER